MTEGKLACYDCGLPYSSLAWADVVITDEDWSAISPTGHEGGVLCFNCMNLRFAELGRDNVPFLITSGPFAFQIRKGKGNSNGK